MATPVHVLPSWREPCRLRRGSMYTGDLCGHGEIGRKLPIGDEAAAELPTLSNASSSQASRSEQLWQTCQWLDRHHT